MKKVKKINPPMKFNSGLMKFEPDLSEKKYNKFDRKVNWRPYFYFVILLVVVLIVLAILRGSEDSWIKDSRGVWIKHGNPSVTPDYVKEQKIAIECAENLYNEKKITENLSSQCLGTCGNYSIDIVRVPRTQEDNLRENQCPEYLSGITSNFIELDKNGEIVRVA